MTCDDRSWAMQAVLCSDVSACLGILYPRMLCLAPLLTGNEPQPLRCTIQKLRDNTLFVLGLYFCGHLQKICFMLILWYEFRQTHCLENGVHMFLWVGSQTPRDVLVAAFGVNAVAEVNTEMLNIPTLDTPLNKALHTLIQDIRMERRRCMRVRYLLDSNFIYNYYLKNNDFSSQLTIIRQHDKLETVFRHFLIEDQGQDGGASYLDFLCHVHKEIRALL
jgi:protein transport protein SEC24